MASEQRRTGRRRRSQAEQGRFSASLLPVSTPHTELPTLETTLGLHVGHVAVVWVV